MTPNPSHHQSPSTPKMIPIIMKNPRSLLPGLLAAFLHVQHPRRHQHQVQPQHCAGQLRLSGKFSTSLRKFQLDQATTLLGYLNSCLNPIIYTIFNPEFRKAFKRVLGLGHWSWTWPSRGSWTWPSRGSWALVTEVEHGLQEGLGSSRGSWVLVTKVEHCPVCDLVLCVNNKHLSGLMLSVNNSTLTELGIKIWT